MKIALINPPFLFPVRDEMVLSQCIGLRSLSSVLKRGGHEVVFVDALMLGFSNVRRYANGYVVGSTVEEIIKQLPSDVDLIGVSVPFSQLAPIAHEIVDRAKSRFSEALVVMGGVYPSTQPELAFTSKADLIVVGEGECALSELATGRKPMEVTGVYSPASGKTGSFLPARFIEDLDSLCFPDYSIPLMDRYFDISPRMVRGRTAALITSRGCPFDCEFCSVHPVCGRRWRARSAENVIDEIKYLVRHHSINSFEIEDDNFTMRRDRTVQILEGIIRLNENRGNLSWRTPNGVRVDALDEEVIRLMKRSNCMELVLALEHGDPELLGIMNKKLDLEKARQVIELCAKSGIPRVTLFVIVGYPGETPERFKNSLSYLKSIRKLGRNLNVCVNYAQPYPGTRLLARCRAEGYVDDPDIDNFLVRRDLMSTAHVVSITTPDFDGKEVRRRKDKIINIFLPRLIWGIRLERVLPKLAMNILKKLASKIFRD